MKQGKQRVETLMDGLLGDPGTLASNRVFLEEMQRQIEPLAKAREELAEVSSSLAESDLAIYILCLTESPFSSDRTEIKKYA